MLKIRDRKSRGFTLIEMIVATALFLTAITASIGIFLSTTKANSRINAMQKVENEVRYIIETIAKEARLGIIYYGYYEEVYGANFENPVPILAVLDNADNVSYFALDGDLTSSGIVQMSLNNGITWSDLSTGSVVVDSLDFYLLPDSDPFDQNAEIIEQPMVILHLEAHYSNPDLNAGKIKIQTSISSRQYKK